MAPLPTLRNLDGIIAGASQPTLLCVPSPLIAPFAARGRGSQVSIGGQDCHTEASGPLTGDVAAGMLADAGATTVIVGHSERRTAYGESDELVRRKAEAAAQAGLVSIVCVGENAEERSAGIAARVVARQFDASVPATATPATLALSYEPIWAIGSGKTPSLEEIGEIHAHLRQRLQARYGETLGRDFCILYGGSVSAANAAGIFAVPEVDGALVGGASLTAGKFLPILAIAEKKT